MAEKMTWWSREKWLKIPGTKGETYYVPVDEVTRLTRFDDGELWVFGSNGLGAPTAMTLDEYEAEVNRAIQVQYDELTAEKDKVISSIKAALEKANSAEQLINLNDFAPKIEN